MPGEDSISETDPAHHVGLRKRSRSREREHGTGAVSDYAESAPSVSNLSGVSDGVCELSESGVSVRSSGSVAAWYGEGGEVLAEEFGKNLRKYADRVHDATIKSDGVLLSDVFRFDNNEEIERFLEVIRSERHHGRGMLSVSVDGLHCHVTHTCKWSNQSCRCNWANRLKCQGLHRRDRHGRRRRLCTTRTKVDIYRAFIYYCTEGRRIAFLQIGGRAQKVPSGGYSVSDAGSAEARLGFTEMERDVNENGDDVQPGGSSGDSNERSEGGAYPRLDTKRRKVGYKENLQREAILMMRKYPCCPPEAIFGTRQWRTHPDLWLQGAGKDYIEAALEYFKVEIKGYSIYDFNKMYTEEGCEPYFSDIMRQGLYYSIEESVRILRELVMYQMDDDEEAALDFVVNLYDVLERKIPKKNSLSVVSPSSAGKNFFFDTFKGYYLNVGNISHINKFASFGFQNCEGRRFVVWNEPNYSPEYFDKIKELIGGDNTTVKVKYKSDMPIFRTPFIIMSNTEQGFMSSPFFKDRLVQYRWREAPYLKNYDKHPNPGAVFEFFKSYGLVE